MENTASDTMIWYILLGLALVYFIIRFKNKKKSNRRKSRGFMEGRRRHKSDE